MQKLLSKIWIIHVGAASLATILNEFYGKSITEMEILKMMNKEDMKASFNDMAKILHTLGFKGIGYALSFDQLIELINELKIPVISYTIHHKIDHFSVNTLTANSGDKFIDLNFSMLSVYSSIACLKCLTHS